jgi:hypothetical protein
MTHTNPLATTTWAGAWLHGHATVTDQGVLVASLKDIGQSYRIRLNGFREGLLVFVDGSILLLRNVSIDGNAVVDPRIWDLGRSARAYKDATAFPSEVLAAIRKAYTGPEQPISVQAKPAWIPKANPFLAAQKDWALAVWALHSGSHTPLDDAVQLSVLSDGCDRKLTVRSGNQPLWVPDGLEDAFFKDLERAPWGMSTWFCNAWVFTQRADRPLIVARAIERTPIHVDVPSWTLHQRLSAAAMVGKHT